MLFVLPVSHVDVHLARILVDRICALGGVSAYPALVVSTIKAAEFVPSLVEKLSQAFKKCDLHVLKSEDERGWPMSCNHIFYSTATYLQSVRNTEPWYFVEADCYPLKSTWADALASAYAKARTAFMGFVCPSWFKRDVDGVLFTKGSHMVGTGIYPPDFLKRSKLIHFVGKVPWDVYIQWEVAKSCTHTELIQHNWNTCGYKWFGNKVVCSDTGRVPEGLSFCNPVRDDAVILHGCKDGSIAQVYANVITRQAA